MKCALGIDTSCYTTSVALVSEGKICARRRRLLRVPEGERGLRQSQGLFQHVQNLPELMAELFDEAPGAEIVCVAASERPRDVDGSYMPVFTAGAGLGRSLAAAVHAPFFATSHQQGHVRAALYGTNLRAERFLGLHLSGGTTEIFLCDQGLNIELLGGTDDISAGQLIDRTGVALGLGFPAGPALEALAARGTATNALPTAVRGWACSFSGGEAQIMRLIAAGCAPETVAAEVFSLVARTVAKLIERGVRECGVGAVLLAGGVASSRLFKALVAERLKRLKCEAKPTWADPELAGDNACGVALIGWQRYEGV